MSQKSEPNISSLIELLTNGGKTNLIIRNINFDNLRPEHYDAFSYLLSNYSARLNHYDIFSYCQNIDPNFIDQHIDQFPISEALISRHKLSEAFQEKNIDNLLSNFATYINKQIIPAKLISTVIKHVIKSTFPNAQFSARVTESIIKIFENIRLNTTFISEPEMEEIWYKISQLNSRARMDKADIGKITKKFLQMGQISEYLLKRIFSELSENNMIHFLTYQKLDPEYWKKYLPTISSGNSSEFILILVKQQLSESIIKEYLNIIFGSPPFLQTVLEHSSFSLQFLDENSNLFSPYDWELISKFQFNHGKEFSIPFTEKHISKFNIFWNPVDFSNQKSIEWFIKFAEVFNWETLLFKQQIPEQFLLRYYYKLDQHWKIVSKTQILTLDFIDKFGNLLDWDALVLSQQLTKEFIEKYEDKINWDIAMFNSSLNDLDDDTYNQYAPKFSKKGIQTGYSDIEKLQLINNNYNDEFLSKGTTNISVYILSGTKYNLSQDKLLFNQQCYKNLNINSNGDKSYVLNITTQFDITNTYHLPNNQIDFDNLEVGKTYSTIMNYQQFKDNNPIINTKHYGFYLAADCNTGNAAKRTSYQISINVSDLKITNVKYKRNKWSSTEITGFQLSCSKFKVLRTCNKQKKSAYK